MRTFSDLGKFASNCLLSGDFVQALRAFALIVRHQASDLDARLRLGDCFLAMGDAQRAASVYSTLARLATHAGYPLRAIVALKLMAELHPDLARLQDVFAALYSADSPRLGRGARPTIGEPEAELPPNLLQLGEIADSPALRDECLAIGSSFDESQMVFPEKLPSVPLLSDLPTAEFAAVLHSIQLRRCQAGERILQQGDVGTSFFVLVRGGAQVSHQNPEGESKRLAALGEGAIFGEMALVSASARVASVDAVGEVDLLEFDGRALAAASERLGVIATALAKFSRERMLNNLLNAAPFFRPLKEQQRIDLMRRFTLHEVPAGTLVVQQGQPGQGLFLVVQGETEVLHQGGSGSRRVATLGPGEVFGEIALLGTEHATADVKTTKASTLLFLDRRYFSPLIEAVPALRQYITQLGAERASALKQPVGAPRWSETSWPPPPMEGS